ncbi:MAG: hypothetical protein M3Z35_05510 [Nitrospirota bacterium]|nr:hypothetical protein [Nitrospirota bacterium]
MGGVVKNNPAYMAAYRTGVRQYETACGAPLVWQMVADTRSGRYRAALRTLWVLLRWYLQGLRDLVTAKFRRLLTTESQASEHGK